jgi:hypothetical protein
MIATVPAGVSYPAQTWQLLAQIEYHGADGPTPAELSRPPVRLYADPQAVIATLNALDPMRPCGCRKPDPRCSCGGLLFVGVFPRRLCRRMSREAMRPGSRMSEGSGRSGWAFSMPLMRSMALVEPFELSKRVDQVPLIPDQGAVEQFVATALDPAFHDR